MPRVDLGPDTLLPPLKKPAQIEPQSQVVLYHAEVPGHVVTPVTAENAGELAHELFVGEMEDPLHFMGIGVEIELLQCLQKWFFPFQIQQGIAEIEPDE